MPVYKQTFYKQERTKLIYGYSTTLLLFLWATSGEETGT